MNKINKQQKPVVLVLAGHDPSGAAGIQADIESIANAGCHAATVISCLTTQNTCEILNITSQPSVNFKKQLELILSDMEIAACKIGLLGSAEIVDVIYESLADRSFPIVLDPIIKAGIGQTLTDDAVCQDIVSKLLPITTVITPNSDEARKLGKTDDLNTAAQRLLEYGVMNVLITGADEKSEQVVNTLYAKQIDSVSFNWTRLTGSYHGSGCTLSSRIAAQLALGKEITEAVEEAQSYTWHSLSNGLELGQCQKHPNRFFTEDNQ